MELSYSLILRDILQNIGLPNSSDAGVLNFIKQRLQTRYQDLLASFSSWRNQQTQTASTVIGQQYYHYPPGVINVESATLQQGTIVYPIRVVNSQEEWDYINQYPNTNTIIPQFIFPRQVDFGIWPVPSQVQTLTFNFIYTTPPLNVADYTTGTVSVTNGSVTVTSSGATFTQDMVGRKMVLTDSSGFPIDFWYVISGVNDGTNELTLQSYYEGTTKTAQNYIIGQVPQLPDEAHIFLSWGVTADWYNLRSDTDKGTRFNNMYYTGDPNNTERDAQNTQGGLLGLRARYAERSDKKIVTMNTKAHSNYYINWVNSILPS